MKLMNFKTIAACACFLIASSMRKTAYLEGRGMHVTKLEDAFPWRRDAVFLWEAATRWQVRKLGTAFVAIHVAQRQCRFKRVSFDSPAENLFVSNYISSINNQDSLANKLKIIYIQRFIIFNVWKLIQGNYYKEKWNYFYYYARYHGMCVCRLMITTFSLYFPRNFENYIILKPSWQTRAESAWQVPKVLRNILESFRRQVLRCRRRRGLDGAVAGGCSDPSGVWVRVRATLGTRSLGISLDFPLYLLTTHRSSGGSSQWRWLSACLPSCLPACHGLQDIRRLQRG